MPHVVSSNLHSIDFDEGILKITFRKKDGTAGATYHYPTASQQVYHELMEAESHGKHFLAHVKPHHKGEKQ